MYPFLPCVPKSLDPKVLPQARHLARQINPANAPPARALARLDIREPQHLALLTSSYWGKGGVDLRVYFMDQPSQALRTKILSHMNAWSQTANVRFREGDARSDLRIARQRGQGYYSYLGTDILSIPRSQQTMNLEGFSENTPDSEFFRVVRHETGHTLGFIHEHLRRELVELLDPQKTIGWFRDHDGWPPNVTQQQVLTPEEEALLTATARADQDSIMCYQLPGEVTKSGQPIRGGTDINQADHDLAARLYPLATAPPPPPPGPGGPEWTGLIEALVRLLGGLCKK